MELPVPLPHRARRLALRDRVHGHLRADCVLAGLYAEEAAQGAEVGVLLPDVVVCHCEVGDYCRDAEDVVLSAAGVVCAYLDGEYSACGLGGEGRGEEAGCFGWVGSWIVYIPT